MLTEKKRQVILGDIFKKKVLNSVENLFVGMIPIFWTKTYLFVYKFYFENINQIGALQNNENA